MLKLVSLLEEIIINHIDLYNFHQQIQLVQRVELNNWIKKESIAFHMGARNALARVRKRTGSSELWLPNCLYDELFSYIPGPSPRI